MRISGLKDLKSKIRESTEIEQRLLENPLEFINKLDEKPPIADKKIFLAVVSIVGLVLLFSIVLGGVLILKSTDSENANVPEFIVSIGSTALGALVGLLAPNHKS